MSILPIASTTVAPATSPVMPPPRAAETAALASPTAAAQGAKTPESDEEAARLRATFNQFIGETFYGQMLKAMRKTVRPAAFANGGRAEEIFQQQLDQTLATKMAEATADRFSGPMYELFNMQRR